MEQIKYRKTLDVHKNGRQFLLQGFQTADKMSRVIEISLMASGDAIDFPLERIVAMMYVTTPGATEPSINECLIKDNKVVYNVLPIVEEGITTMQLKLIETSIDGAKSVLASPEFAVEVSKSNLDDNGEELKTTFTALETAIAKSDAVYNSRLLRIEVDENCGFKAYYSDGTIYYSDEIAKKILSVTTDMDLTSLVKSGLVSFTADEVSDKVIEDISDEIDYKMGQAKYVKDLLSNFEKATFVMWDSLTLHSPFSDGKTSVTQGFAFVNGDVKTNHTIIAYVNGINKNTCFVHSIVNGEDKGWSDKVDLTSEVKGVLPIELGGTNAIDLESAKENLGIKDLDWVTLASVAVNDSLSTVRPGSYTMVNPYEEHKVISFNIDDNVVKDFTSWRMVIKKGSTVKMKFGYEDRNDITYDSFLTSFFVGGNPDTDLYSYIKFAEFKFFLADAMQPREHTFVLEEDLICNVANVDSRNNIENDLWVITKDNISMGQNIFKSEYKSLMVVGHVDKNKYGGSIEYSLNVEIQGKR